ncbi:hypothetical protein BUALT_Bualt02G0087000 [Buddleja alternifolia]|uniref:Uncharacterized protein n=1 Tax=Buddleja alternifolia TaxID=168488 RepID=A0AAV6XYM7_9LAMI|nr:hypothetical protein BUALT_Bualt02G0087000 [Buddleja alternifolia]
MATSSFKSTTKRAPFGSSSSEDSSRRSRSLSRFSRPIADSEPDYNKNAPRGKFVNTKRGSATPFPEISLDDLALEFFSSSSNSKNENESDGGGRGLVERQGRSVARRWETDTASSRRKGRSVSRTRGGDAVSSSSASRGKNVFSSDAGSRRRRSLSVSRYQISDSERNDGRSENDPRMSDTGPGPLRVYGNITVIYISLQSEVDHSRNSSNRANLKTPVSGNKKMTLAVKAPASSTRRLGRSRSHKDFSALHDGYSSHSSILTDDESKDTHIEKHGFEKIIRPVYAKKSEHTTEVVSNGGFYETMWKELRYAVEETRTELNQAMGRNLTSLTTGDCMQSEKSQCLQDFSRLEKRKQDLLTEMLLEEQRGQDVSKMIKEPPNSRTSAAVDKPSRARKKSGDRSRMSERLIEEAERYFEDFICNVEDTDISSFDGERSDGSSTLGGTVNGRYGAIREAEICKTPTGSTTHAVEMDGVILPWLQWETSHDGSLSGTNKAQTPLTPKALQWDSEKEMILLHDPSNNSISSYGSWSPGVFSSPLTVKRDDMCKTRQVDNGCISCYDMDEYLKLGNNEELLFEMYRERNRISSGGVLLCTSFLF